MPDSTFRPARSAEAIAEGKAFVAELKRAFADYEYPMLAAMDFAVGVQTPAGSLKKKDVLNPS